MAARKQAAIFGLLQFPNIIIYGRKNPWSELQTQVWTDYSWCKIRVFINLASTPKRIWDEGKMYSCWSGKHLHKICTNLLQTRFLPAQAFRHIIDYQTWWSTYFVSSYFQVERVFLCPWNCFVWSGTCHHMIETKLWTRAPVVKVWFCGMLVVTEKEMSLRF